tara:strand:+ start:852 stop:1763 length:912 start_codon:yes stop_codon:yes gene_type:complete
MKSTDVILLTENCYEDPTNIDQYVQNVLTEDGLVKKALEKLGCSVKIIPWDKTFDWSSAHIAVFRTTWDYFHRFSEFSKWLSIVKTKTTLINSYDQIIWNLDKHYLQEISNKGINIPSSYFIKKNSSESIQKMMTKNKWEKVVLKPTISGAARHTFKIDSSNVADYEQQFAELIKHEDFMLQEFQENVLTKGEISFMVFGGKFTHAIQKKAKEGDFRVQDDFGGSVHSYSANEKEISFCEKVVAALDPKPIYARVDVIWDNNNNLAVSELELIEPELWFRYQPDAADKMAQLIFNQLKELKNI